MDVREAKRGRSRIAVVLRTLFYALAIAFIVGFVVGTVLRKQLERPVRYMGFSEFAPREAFAKRRTTLGEFATLAADSIGPTDPGHVGDALTSVLVPRDHE